ncbi:hypothetical protein SBA3_410031 [Candidatus Sulfopaludibacter sp. SbA3]|nr:hypothetical protein SBA3_410031 [Candidatus Sulfopaludibacter sp. SbA3]
MGGRNNNVHRRHTVFLEQAEFPQVDAGAHVGAERDLDSRLVGSRHHLVLELNRFSHLGRHFRRGIAGRRTIHRRHRHHDGGHQIRAVLLEQTERRRIGISAMFDRVHAQAQRVIDGFLTLRVRGDLHTKRVRGIDSRFDFLVGHQLQMRIVASAEHAAARHDLDQVSAALMVFAHRGHHLVRTRDHRAGQPHGIERKIGIERVGRVAVTASRTERLERDPHARPRDHSRIDGVLQGQIDSVRRADAADRGEPFFQNLTHGNGRGQHGIQVGPRTALGDSAAAAPGSRGDVLVRVDEARQHCPLGKVDHLRPGHRHESRLHPGDFVVFNKDRNLCTGRIAGAIDQSPGVDDNVLGGRAGWKQAEQEGDGWFHRNNAITAGSEALEY